MKSKVVDSRPLTNGWTQRLRECSACQERWYTFEVPAELCEMQPSDMGKPIVNRNKK